LTAAPVIVTRPERDALRWVQDLQQHGLRAEALPLLEIAPLPESAQLLQAWAEVGAFDAVMFVSGNAVDGFFASTAPQAMKWREKHAIDTVAKELRFLAPGPGTVAALLGAGVPAGQIDAPPAHASQFDSEALWRVAGGRSWQAKRVLIVRGQGAGEADATSAPGRDWLARQFLAAGAQVDFLAVYQRRAPRFTAQQLLRAEAAATDGSVWLFSSSEAVGHLPPHDWSRARAVATHPRIAQAVRAAGWGVVAESRPALKDIVASIESMQP
jgi:uroporphyrinogen-III synthase